MIFLIVLSITPAVAAEPGNGAFSSHLSAILSTANAFELASLLSSSRIAS